VPFETKALDTEIYRVGRPPDPWAFTDWVYAGKDGTFGGRWDDANGRYRVIYASSQRLGAFLEALAKFRPDPSVISEYQTIEVVDGDEDGSSRHRAADLVPGTRGNDWGDDGRPWSLRSPRVLQDFATLDLLSGGRAEIMAGRGSFIESFPLFGYDLADYDELFASKLELLLALRDSEHVTWSGKHRAPLHDLGV
jgi:hypothetical protein